MSLGQSPAPQCHPHQSAGIKTPSLLCYLDCNPLEKRAGFEEFFVHCLYCSFHRVLVWGWASRHYKNTHSNHFLGPVLDYAALLPSKISASSKYKSYLWPAFQYKNHEQPFPPQQNRVLRSTHNSTNMTGSSCTAWQSPTPRKTAWARNPLQISNNASLSNKVRSLAQILKVTNTTVCSQVPKMLFESDEEPEVVFLSCG